MPELAAIEWLRGWLEGWPTPPPDEPPSGLPPQYRRLRDAIESLLPGAPMRSGAADVAALFRQVLRFEDERHGGGSYEYLSVPATRGWPDAACWRRACVDTVARNDRLVIRAMPWHPSWLNTSTDPASRTFRGHVTDREHDSMRYPADDFFLEASGEKCETYSTAGQRQAVRAIMSAPPAATVVANLPTGSGKSMVAYAPALVWGAGTGGVSIVVVPTTALALDQERAFRALLQDRGDQDAFPQRFAYHGELDPPAKEAFRARIRSGEQTIVFTSPEALVQSLAPAVHSAAREGRLRLLALDEAHLVSQWGDEFRPAFQQVAGLRRDLLRAVPDVEDAFRTLAMTGTLSEDSLRTLAALFGDPGPIEVVSSVLLRPEASYWSSACPTDDDRAERLLEALACLPRPLLVYVTEPDETRHWVDRLNENGYRRVAAVSGGTPPRGRLAAIRALRGENEMGVPVPTGLDVVVGTSAFGLGVDQPDVRAVVHACIPESIDRYYQEVGRGGRDRRPTVALLLHTPDDIEVAEGLNARRIISVDFGLERWQRMLERVAETDQLPQGVRVSLNVPRTPQQGDSPYSKAWNTRTLLLMSRAGLIRLRAEPPPTRPEGTTQAEVDHKWEQEMERRRDTMLVEIIDPGHRNRATWESRVEPARRRSQAADALSLEFMREVLDLPAQRDIAAVLVQAYQIDLPNQAADGWPIVPVRSCGGCDWCRRNGVDPYEGLAPDPSPSANVDIRPSDALARLLGRSHRVAVPVTYDPARAASDLTEDLEELALRAVENGVRVIVDPAAMLERRVLRRLRRRSSDGYLFTERDYEPINLPALPALVLLPASGNGVGVGADLLEDMGPPRLVLLPADAEHPEYPARHTVAEVRPDALTLDEALEALSCP